MAQERAKRLREKVALRIREILAEKDLTQAYLADGIGTYAPNVSRIMSAQVNLTLETIAAIEEALGEPILNVVSKNDRFEAKQAASLLKRAKQKI